MSAQLDLELLRSLSAIADTGSFAAAADRVHRTQSAISMQMKRLEEIVGQPLFEKQGRRAILTAHGRNLLLYARRLIELHDEALASFRSPEMHGEVRLGVCDDRVMGFMPPILASYARAYPQVHISLDSQTSARLIQATQSGELDLALVNVMRPDIDCEVLRHEDLVWVVARDHCPHEAEPIPLATETNCLWSTWARQALDRGGKHYRHAYTTFNQAGLSAVVEAGLAVSIMARSTVPPGLRVLTPTEGFPDLPTSSIGLICAGRNLSPAAQRLAEAIRQGFVAEPMAA